ncbi:MmcB family DNA repair protein [Ancylobacter sp. 6x-1]|uniref:MmcB family DNA repair protein n=2 Tax=Ancylobacter crimeensis TaxID=2579147 RepID=A0ABT0DAE4_9HYPH|nr:MmcB family DNA repair protein [Ancylobacter crimeensis]
MALAIRRGAMRLLASAGLTGVPELPLASGRRADIVALDGRGEVWIVEIKSSLADFRADRKWPDYRLHCDRLFFAVAPDFPLAVLPEEVGIILADGFGAAIERQAPHHPMPGATRRALTLRYARAAAARMMALADPDGFREMML